MHRLPLLRVCLVLGLLLAVRPPAGAQEPEILRPEQAFRYVVADTGDALEIDWSLEDGYYLYRDKLGFATDTPGISLGEPVLPEGLHHEDEFFGVQAIYRRHFFVRLPYTTIGTTIGARPDSLALTLKLQGCADLGICYPPQTWTTSVALADGAPQPTASGKLSLADPLGAHGDFLPVDEAFRPTVTALDGNTLEVSLQIAPGYYLYRDKIGVSTDSDRVQLGRLALPPGETKTDEYFGTVQVYHDDVFASLPVARGSPEALAMTLDLSYQGCADGGICYPPVSRRVTVNLPAATAVTNPDGAADRGPPLSEQARLAALIAGASLWVVVGTCFGAGLLLAMTPCVLPMVPILAGIVAGDGDDVGPARGFSLALSYVLGMALVYTAAGIAAAAVGIQLQAVFNQPWVLILFAALFVLLALGMFGLFDLQMPSAVQSRLAAASGRQKSGTVIGAFVMGALSSLIVTACVAPALVATLTVIGQGGDMVRGGLALFSLSLGMGAPLLIVGASAGKLLPKAGPWMVAVKNAFGFMMLGLAVWMLSRILPSGLTLALSGALVFMAGVWLGGLSTLPPEAPAGRLLGKGAGLLAILYGAALVVGALAGGDSLTRPLAGLSVAQTSGPRERGLSFRRIKSVADLDEALAAAAADGRTAMLDFYADWCVSCIEMEKYTFSDPAVERALSNSVLLKADVTANDAEDQALLARFGVFGPPTIVFFGPDGRQRQGYEVVGYMKAAAFAEHVRQATAVDGITARAGGAP